MTSKFSRKELERLNCTEEEISLVMKYQSKLPILVDNYETKKYCVNISNLYTQLGVKTRISKWIDTNLIANFSDSDYKIIFLDSENNTVSFEGLCDYSSQKLTRLNISKTYMITLDCAKEIAMFAGTQLHAN